MLSDVLVIFSKEVSLNLSHNLVVGNQVGSYADANGPQQEGRGAREQRRRLLLSLPSFFLPSLLYPTLLLSPSFHFFPSPLLDLRVSIAFSFCFVSYDDIRFRKAAVINLPSFLPSLVPCSSFSCNSATVVSNVSCNLSYCLNTWLVNTRFRIRSY